MKFLVKFHQLNLTPRCAETHKKYAVKPVYNGHPRDLKIVAVVDRWSLFRGTFMLLTRKTVTQNSGCYSEVIVSSGSTYSDENQTFFEIFSLKSFDIWHFWARHWWGRTSCRPDRDSEKPPRPQPFECERPQPRSKAKGPKNSMENLVQ